MPRRHVVTAVLLATAHSSVFTKEEKPKLQARDGDGYHTEGYGVDVSFPMHYDIEKGTWGAKMYDEFINGCGDKYNLRSCRSNEESRMAMDRDQIPRQRNFTELGFAKLRAPKAVYEAAREFWDLHRETQTSESWPPGNTYVNHWVADSTMCSFEDRRLQPLGFKTKDIIWDQARPILEAWTGQKLKPTSLYGIRSYFRGAILATHVDRLPLVTSAIINVDQDVDEDWPIEVVGHDGVAYNVTLKPGDMALYESHTVLHGRPFPLKGNFYANLFVHFIPVDPDDPSKNHPDIDFGWTSRARNDRRDPKKAEETRRKLAAYPKPDSHEVCTARARKAAADSDARRSGVPARGPLPEEPKRKRGPSPAESRKLYKRRISSEEPGHQHVGGEDFGHDSEKTGTRMSLHEAAAVGDLEALKQGIAKDPSSVNAPDENLWTPLHEAARSGSLETVEFLVEHGANLGDTVLTGASALNIARKFKHNQVIAFLDTLGAPDIADQEL